jgi:hypothetical protein
MNHLPIYKVILSTLFVVPSFAFSQENSGLEMDSVHYYTVVSEKTSTYFISKNDTVKFSSIASQSKTKSIAEIKVDGKCFYLFNDVDLAYEISVKPTNSPMFILFLELPYGKLTIDEGIYANPKIVKERISSSKELSCIVRINSVVTKKEQELGENDFIEAAKLRKKPIEDVIIYDDKESNIYSSLNKTPDTNSSITYAFKINKSQSEANRLLLKVSTFMILWVYHKN